MPGRSDSTVQPALSEPWKEPCANKRKKKESLSGGNRRGSTRKRRTSPFQMQFDDEDDASEDEDCGSIQEFFRELTDPRVNRRRVHLLIDIIVIALCAVIGGAEKWKDIALWGETHHAWLSQFLELPAGIPSRCTFRRVISRLNPEQFQACFRAWVQALCRTTKGRIIAIDGKTLRRSMDSASELKALHLVSAWASEQNLTLGQVAVEEKSNEITAIPRLLELLELSGALVTIDAMGCQKAIAQQIIDAKGDFCLAVKGNQETLYNDLREFFSDDSVEKVWDEYSSEETSHGRFMRRYYYTAPAPEHLQNSSAWPKVKSVGLAITYRSKTEDEQVAPECRYYILSVGSNARRFAKATRLHWGIENSLHWVLDVTFDEDQSRIRKDNGAENVGWLRRIAISLLKNEPTVKDSIRAKRLRATYDVEYLGKVLLAAANSQI